jgi:hypothetical protein
MTAIPGVRVTGTIVPTDSADTYATIDPIYGIDGMRSEANKTARNAIPDARRRQGMLVCTQDTMEVWQLKIGPWAGTDADWQLLGAAIAAAAGDLSGTWPNITVVGVEGKPILAAPTVGGSRLTYNVTTGQLNWIAQLVYTSLALAAAAQGASGQIIGQQVIIYGSAGGAEDGTYSITAITGTIADYTKISDATNTAAEVAIVDAGNYYSSTNVEGALQELGPKTSTVTVPLVNGVATTAASVLVDAIGRTLWTICLYNTTGVRENWFISASHNGYSGADATGTPNYTIYGPGPDASGHIIEVDLNGVGVAQVMRLRITAAAVNWSVDINTLSQVAGAA